ncbi:MAG: hypothetical protein KQH53_00320 [Desulfarculaceae bacterium]|nr:hypothetical protein [Desulfarculaceae bacterium]
MSRKRLPRRSIFAAAALLLALLAAPAVLAQSGSGWGWGITFNSISVTIINQSQEDITIMGYMLQEGQWSPGQQPNSAGSGFANGSTLGPYGTESQQMGQGNGGAVYLNLGTVSWRMASGGQPQLQAQLYHSGLQAQTEGPFGSGQKYTYRVTISKQ